MKQMVALYVGLLFAALIGLALPAQCDEVRDFYIKTVHLDGNTSTKGDADHADVNRRAKEFLEDGAVRARASTARERSSSRWSRDSFGAASPAT